MVRKGGWHLHYWEGKAAALVFQDQRNQPVQNAVRTYSSTPATPIW